jgi:Tol biopolymer transport system component
MSESGGLRQVPWGVRRDRRHSISGAAVALALLMGTVTAACGDLSLPPPTSQSSSARPLGSAGSSTPTTASPPPAPSLRPPSNSPAPPTDDHSPLIVSGYGPNAIDLFTLDAFTGKRAPMGRLRLGAEVAGQSIHWSADHRSAFVFADFDSVSARIDIASGSVDSLDRLGPSASRDAVSPSGNAIARLTDQNDIEIIDLNGHRIRLLPLPNGIRPLLRIVWSPDSTRIAVSSCLPCDNRKEAGPWHVLIASVDGSPVRIVGEIITTYIGIDDWSPDGTRLVYGNAVDDGMNAASGGVGILDLATGTASQLTNEGEDAASWSPDGDRIVFDSGFGGSELSVIDADGAPASRHVLATSEAGFGFDDPIWSPNGDWILYRVIPMDGVSQTGIGDLWMVPSRGGEPRLVVERAIADW